MNNKISAIIGFVAGIGAGFTGCYVYLKKKNEKKLTEEVESIKNTYEKLGSIDPSANKPDDIKNQDKIDKFYKDASDGIKSYVDNKQDTGDSEDEEESDEDQETDSYDRIDSYDDDYDIDSGDISEYEKIVKSYSPDDSIILITEPEYADTTIGYDKKEVTIYVDGDEYHAVDVDTGHEMICWESELGYEEGLLNDELFEEYSGIVYIRNNDLCTDYLVSKSSAAWV